MTNLRLIQKSPIKMEIHKGSPLAKRKKEIRYYNYDCSLTGQSYKLTAKAPNPDDLMSVEAYYQMHAEEDDRPAAVKKKLGIVSTETPPQK